MRGWIAAVGLVLVLIPAIDRQAAGRADERYLTWSASEAEAIGKATYKQGRVGGLFDTRMLKTERSYNYKLAATWLTPDVVRATARLLQIRSRLTDDETRAIVDEAEQPGGTVIIVEIDPREGSGVIPRDWEAFLQPKSHPHLAVLGTDRPGLRDIRGLAGVLRRNYDYDRFWVTFPLSRGETALFQAGHGVAELVVRIYDKEGRVEWPVPASLIRRP